MKFYTLLVKYGLKTALSDLKLRGKNWWVKGRITWRNKRLWKMWKRNTEIIPMAMFISLAIAIATILAVIPSIIEINNNQSRYYECPTIRRILVPEVSAKEMTIQDHIIEIAENGGVNPETALRIAKCESQFGKYKTNWQGSSAYGLYQFMPTTWNAYCDGNIENDLDQIKCFVKLYPTHSDWWQCK